MKQVLGFFIACLLGALTGYLISRIAYSFALSPVVTYTASGFGGWAIGYATANLMKRSRT